jgi:uncharacterized protein YprB with RNaseH-like and TPR domain
LQDVVRYFGTDILYTRQVQYAHFLRDATPESVSVACHNPRSSHAEVLKSESGVTLVAVTSPTELQEFVAENTVDGGTYILSDLLTLSIDLIQLETELQGLSEYKEALAGAAGELVHLTTGANPTYEREWSGLRVHGVMPGVNEQQGTSEAGVGHVQLREDGTVLCKTRSLSDFGLETVTGVGSRRAEALREESIESRAELAAVEPHELTRLDGVGAKTARKIVESAEVIEQQELRVAPGASLPDVDPIFIDIETDGLNPTIIWLIGVLERGPEDRYLPFLETDPSQPGRAVTAFMEWLAAHGRGRPVVAYNGWEFDFPVIAEHVAEHCPEHVETWEDTWKFDLYYWAVKQSNALLPGLTNKLDDVASAVGWDGVETGLTGRAVGRRFQRYAESPSSETELEWERHKQYCEDDVRGLAHIYDRIAETETLMAQAGSGRESGSSESTQGTLTDFSS